MYFLVVCSIHDFVLLRTDPFSISICFSPEPENDPVGITLNTSDLTKCEWCNVRKLPVVFLQTTPAVYQKLSMQLQMNMKDNVWNDCKGINKLTSKLCRINRVIHTVHWLAGYESALIDTLELYYLQSLEWLCKINITSLIIQVRKSPQKVKVLKIKPRFTHLESFQNGLKLKRYILFILTLYNLSTVKCVCCCCVFFMHWCKTAISLESLKLSLKRRC